MKSSDQYLWTKVQMGDIKAFEVLYKNYFSSLCLYAFSYIPDEEQVKEIVNDVFSKIWQKNKEISINYELKAYLFRCVHNACVDYFETEGAQIRNRFVSSDKLINLKGQDEECILEQIILNDIETDLTKSIDKLPSRCREIFLLSRFDLLTYNEISEKLNISINTVKTQISRALDSLREDLKTYIRKSQNE